jgi:predicted dehydrogenase
MRLEPFSMIPERRHLSLSFEPMRFVRHSPLRPVFVLGAGAIVRDAHVPAYRLAGVPIRGFFDLDRGRAEALAATCPGSDAFASLDDALAACERAHGVLDVALPPQAIASTFERIPAGATVLLQKPFGRTLEEATALRALLAARSIRGAVNFQLRHAPVIRALRQLLASGAIGEVVDLEIRVVCRMPWETWPFLRGMPRMEILMHSIHYLDLCRALLGEPSRVWSWAAPHPAAPEIADARSTTMLAFESGDTARRAVVTTYHHHAAPEGHDASHLRVEGTRGTAVARLGVNLDYPRGRSDTLAWSANGGAWREEPVAGNWFPHAFAGSMGALLEAVREGRDPTESNFDDAWRTMALVETCYKSAAGGERVPELPE